MPAITRVLAASMFLLTAWTVLSLVIGSITLSACKF